MGIGREVLYAAGKAASDAENEWCENEIYEDENGKTEIFKFRARKIHTRATKEYKTEIEIKNNNDFCIKTEKSEVKFKKSDILGAELKMALMFSIFYTVLSVAVGVMLIACGMLPGVILFAIPFYTALIRSVQIKLKDGRTVKVYYNLKGDADMFLARLNG